MYVCMSYSYVHTEYVALRSRDSRLQTPESRDVDCGPPATAPWDFRQGLLQPPGGNGTPWIAPRTTGQGQLIMYHTLSALFTSTFLSFLRRLPISIPRPFPPPRFLESADYTTRTCHEHLTVRRQLGFRSRTERASLTFPASSARCPGCSLFDQSTIV